MSLLSEVWRWRKYLRHPVTRSVTALQYFWPLAFCNRVAPGRRPVCQPRRHAWLWLLAALLLGLPERRGLLSPGRFHQPVAPSQPRLPLWTGGPRRHQWTVRLWLWGPIAGFGGQLDGEGGEELVGFPCLGRFLCSLGGGGGLLKEDWKSTFYGQIFDKNPDGVLQGVGKMFCVVIGCHSWNASSKISK